MSQPFFDELHALGPRAPAVLLLDGGDHSYWHDRRDGGWGTMVLREAIPAGVARTHAARVAIGGMSMGGFGAFDDAADFARHDLVAHPPRYSSPVWIDVGTDDPFRTADTAFAKEMHGIVTLHIWPGGQTARTGAPTLRNTSASTPTPAGSVGP